MRTLADQKRFEEAALARDRLRALAEALERSRRDRWLLSPGELLFRDGTGVPLRIRDGALVRSDDDPTDPIGDENLVGSPPSRERADEVAVLRAWVTRHPIRLEHADVPPCEPVDGGARLHHLLMNLRSRERDGSER